MGMQHGFDVVTLEYERDSVDALAYQPAASDHVEAAAGEFDMTAAEFDIAGEYRVHGVEIAGL
jgi:hypothetical protein